MSQGHVHDTRDADSRSLTIALGLILGFMVLEVAAGIVASSLALISDSAHMLTDAFALGLSLLAARLAVRPAQGSLTYGLGRAEILSAQANGVTLLVLALVLLYESISRLVHPETVKGGIVLVVAIVGVIVNVAATRVLAGKKDHERSLNVEGSFRHILTDLYGFIATAIAAIIILTTGFDRADPIASLVVVALMLHASWQLLIASGRVFMEAAPAGLKPEQIGRELAAYPGVVEVHDLHVWEVTSGFPALSAHVVVRAGADCHELRRELQQVLLDSFDIHHTTLQVDHEAAPQPPLQIEVRRAD
jgi:cobalt-zinc-cadmium efflux system protein